MFSDDNFSITEDQAIMRLAPNYNRALYSYIAPFLKGAVLEVGSGIGNFTEKIIEVDEVTSVTCFEIDASCCERFKENLSSFKNKSKVTLYEYNFNQSDLKERFDFAFSFNVLEHIEDDRTTIIKIVKYLKSEGWLFLYLPAMQCLYGSIDKELCHYRRYNKAMIRELFCGLPAQIVDMEYSNSIEALGWFYTNRILKRKSQSRGMVSFYDKYIFPAARASGRYLPKFFGANLFVLARRKD